MSSVPLTAPGETGNLGKPTKVRYKVIAFALTLAVITSLDRITISFAAPFIRQDLGISAVQMGWIFAVFAWAYAIFQVPSGYVGDRIGPRRVLMLVVVWWSAFTSLTGWAWNFTSLATTQFFFGAGEAGCFPNLTKAFSVWLPSGERVRAQGLLWLCSRWGGAFSPLLIAVMIGHFGWRYSFTMLGGLGLVWAVFFYRWFRDNPMENRELNGAERALLVQGARIGTDHKALPWRALLRAPQVQLLCLQYFCLAYGWYFYVTWLPTYLREGRHVAMTKTAVLSMLPLFLGGLGNMAFVAILKPLTRAVGNVALARKIIAMAGFAGACSLVLLSTRMADPLNAMLCIGGASFCGDMAMPNAWAATMDVGGRCAGTVSAMMNMFGNAGGAMSSIVIGYILSMTHNNWNMAFYVSAAIYSMGIVFWAFLDPVTPLREAAEPAV